MRKYRCTVCSYMYNPELGDPINGIKPGTLFEDLPEGWKCPRCGRKLVDFKRMAIAA